MAKKKEKKIDFSSKRLGNLADKFYNEGNYLSALRFAYRQLEEYGGDGDAYARLSDIYEGMSLNGSAVNWWFRFLDIADESDLPDIYEGLAVNFLNLGNESISAFYYNKLIDVDDSLPEESKFDIVSAFSSAKKSGFRFVYPPHLADYTQELTIGSRALKKGDCDRAIEELSKVEKGSKDFATAKEIQAVAYLLKGDPKSAETLCLEALEEKPDDVRVQSTLAAAYLEQNRETDSKEIAVKLAALLPDDVDDLYKVATVCCENGLHEEAYQKFCELDKRLPYEGRTLYFKAVSAFKSGHIKESEKALDELCTIYPEAEVAKYYLAELRNYREGLIEKLPEMIYFYHLPQEQREERCRTLIRIGSCTQDEAILFGAIAESNGYFRWCFDEMDGGDQDLQYLAVVTAAHVRADEFLRDVLLDYEVMDFLKIEILRLFLERNEDIEVGLVLYNIYRRIRLRRICIGRKKRKRFIQSYAKIASKFVALHDPYGAKIKQAAETLYRALEKYGSMDLIDNTDNCACAIFVLSGLKELGRNLDEIAAAFEANKDKVNVLLSVALSGQYGLNKDGGLQKEEGNANETD